MLSQTKYSVAEKQSLVHRCLIILILKKSLLDLISKVDNGLFEIKTTNIRNKSVIKKGIKNMSQLNYLS